jgi:hypothetical protein
VSAKPSPRQVYDTLDDAITCVTRFNAEKTLTLIAAEMGWTPQQLSDATDPNKKPRFAANWIEPLTKTTGDDAIVRTLCARVGGVFVPLPRVTGDAREIVAALGEVMREVGESAALITAQLSDGRIDALEAADAIKEVDQALTCMSSLRLLLQQRLDAKGAK